MNYAPFFIWVNAASLALEVVVAIAILRTESAVVAGMFAPFIVVSTVFLIRQINYHLDKAEGK